MTHLSRVADVPARRNKAGAQLGRFPHIWSSDWVALGLIENLFLPFDGFILLESCINLLSVRLCRSSDSIMLARALDRSNPCVGRNQEGSCIRFSTRVQKRVQGVFEPHGLVAYERDSAFRSVNEPLPVC